MQPPSVGAFDGPPVALVLALSLPLCACRLVGVALANRWALLLLLAVMLSGLVGIAVAVHWVALHPSPTPRPDRRGLEAPFLGVSLGGIWLGSFLWLTRTALVDARDFNEGRFDEVLGDPVEEARRRRAARLAQSTRRHLPLQAREPRRRPRL